MINPILKEQARRLYFQATMSQRQIADIINVNERTLFDWIKEGDWKRARATATAAPTLIADKYYSQLAQMSECIEQRDERPYATKEEADIIRKLTMSIRQLKGTLASTASETIQFCMLFSNFLRKKAPEITPQVINIMDEFVKSVMPENQTVFKTSAAEKEIQDDYDQYLQQQRHTTPTQAAKEPPMVVNNPQEPIMVHQKINESEFKTKTITKTSRIFKHKTLKISQIQPTLPEETGSKPGEMLLAQTLGLKPDLCTYLLQLLIGNLRIHPLSNQGLTPDVMYMIKDLTECNKQSPASFLSEAFSLSPQQICAMLDHVYDHGHCKEVW